MRDSSRIATASSLRTRVAVEPAALDVLARRRPGPSASSARRASGSPRRAARRRRPVVARADRREPHVAWPSAPDPDDRGADRVERARRGTRPSSPRARARRARSAARARGRPAARGGSAGWRRRPVVRSRARRVADACSRAVAPRPPALRCASPFVRFAWRSAASARRISSSTLRAGAPNVAQPTLAPSRRSPSAPNGISLDRVCEALGQLARLVLAGAHRDHRELVAALTAADVLLAQRVAQRDRDEPQRVVAGEVAELVVDRLEAVEVHQHEREGVVVAPRTRHLRGQLRA